MLDFSKVNEELLNALLDQIGELNDPVEGETQAETESKIEKAKAIIGLADKASDVQRVTLEARRVNLEEKRLLLEAWELAGKSDIVYEGLKDTPLLTGKTAG